MAVFKAGGDPNDDLVGADHGHCRAAEGRRHSRGIVRRRRRCRDRSSSATASTSSDGVAHGTARSRDVARVRAGSRRRSPRCSPRRSPRCRAATRICSPDGSMLFSTPGGGLAPGRSGARVAWTTNAGTRASPPASTIAARCSCGSDDRDRTDSVRRGHLAVMSRSCQQGDAPGDRRRQHQHRSRRVRRPALVQSWRLQTLRERTSDELGLLVDGLFAHSRIERVQIRGVILGSVVPPLTGTIRAMVQRYFGVTALVVEPGVNTGCRSSTTTRRRSAPIASSTRSRRSRNSARGRTGR